MSKGIVLLIDDDPHFLAIMQEVLEMEDYAITGMTAPENLDSMISSLHPDVILIDYCLSGADGGEICKQLKKDGRNANLPVILTSAYPFTQLSFTNIPFTLFLPKPFDLWKFLSCLQQLIERGDQP